MNIEKGDIGDNMESCVLVANRLNVISAAFEAACLVSISRTRKTSMFFLLLLFYYFYFQILSVDETVKNAKSGDGGPPQMPMGRGMGRPPMMG